MTVRARTVVSLATVAFLWSGTATAQQQSTTTVGGYGELHYNEPDGSARGQLDFHRFVLYLNHSFSPEIGFTSEVELEHTRIESFPSQIRDGKDFSRLLAPLEREFSGILPGIYWLIVPVGATGTVLAPLGK